MYIEHSVLRLCRALLSIVTSGVVSASSIHKLRKLQKREIASASTKNHCQNWEQSPLKILFFITHGSAPNARKG